MTLDLSKLFQRPAQPQVSPFPTVDLSKVKNGADIIAAIADVKAKIEEQRVAREEQTP
jgi:hypothetical protein